MVSTPCVCHSLISMAYLCDNTPISDTIFAGQLSFQLIMLKPRIIMACQRAQGK